MQERAERTRRHLLSAAATLFDHVGYDRATLAAISDRAEVTKGALSFHFASKQDLALEVERIASEQSCALLNRLYRPGVAALQITIDMTHVLAWLMTHDVVTRAGAEISRNRCAIGANANNCHVNWLRHIWDSLHRAREETALCANVDVGSAASVLLSVSTVPVSPTLGAYLQQRQRLDHPPNLPDSLTASWDLLLPRLSGSDQHDGLNTAGTVAAWLRATAGDPDAGPPTGAGC